MTIKQKIADLTQYDLIAKLKSIFNSNEELTTDLDNRVSGLEDISSSPYASKFIKSNESLALAQRKDNTLYGILDQYTGEEITLSKVTGTPTVDNIIYFQLGSEYFKRNDIKIIDSRWFGFVSDLVLDINNNYVSGTDNSIKLTNMLVYTGDLKIAKGNYYFGSNNFKIKSNTHLNLDGSVLKYKSTSIFSPFLLVGGESFLSENITLQNAKIFGNKNELATVTEFMHGISIIQCKNIVLKNIESNLNRGDGLYLGMSSEIEENRTSNIIIENCYFDRNHRQGMSIVSAQYVDILNSKFTNTSGTAPQCGVDIEPNLHVSGFKDYCRFINFENCEFTSNSGGGLAFAGILNSGTNYDEITNIKVNNCNFLQNTGNQIDIRACSNVEVTNSNFKALTFGIIFEDAITKNITLRNLKIEGARVASGAGIFFTVNTKSIVSEEVNISGCEVFNFGNYGILSSAKGSTYLKGFNFYSNIVRNCFHNIKIDTGFSNANYYGNKSFNVGKDSDNVTYPSWSFGWTFQKGDEKATRVDNDIDLTFDTKNFIFRHDYTNNKIGIGNDVVLLGNNTAVIGNSSTTTTSIMGSILATSTVRLKTYTVATLPIAVEGDTAYVTDALAPTYLGTLVGGGSIKCPAFYNGTAWVSH